MSKPTAAQWAELDSSDIASITSADLNAHRPNRWRGPDATWRNFTEDERSLWQSLKTLENQDLSAHLYNAFSLKKRAKNPELAEDLKIETEDGKEAIWAPTRLWTAWPLAEGRVPVEEFVARREDEDEDFTSRKKGERMPSDDLQDEISATMLRMAKKRFLKRKKAWDAVQPSVEDEEDGEDEHKSVKEDTEVESDEVDMVVDDDDYATDAASRASSTKVAKTYEPVVSANDELSYELLAPSTRHIITKLESTLRILHHTRAFAATGNDDADDTSGSEPESAEEEPVVDLQPKLKTTNRGRPRKVHIPHEGESYEEMLIRLARAGHRRVPKQAHVKRGAPAAEKAAEKAAEEADADFDAWMKQEEESGGTDDEGGSGEEDEAKGQTDPNDQDDAFKEWLDQEEEEKEALANNSTNQRKLGLRDWSDVVGAAALAGFPPDVIARTVQRCSNLFGESMVIRDIQEGPHQERGIYTTEYRPEQIQLSDSDEALPESGDDMALEDRRTQSRRYSRMQSSRLSASPSATSFRSRSRTPRSRSASVGQLYFCPVLECERAARGFPRRANLRRHMGAIHDGMDLDIDSASSPGSGGSSVDSEDEMLGAVHVDGFLKPVAPGKGWRGEDVESRKRKEGSQKRRRTEETDNSGGDAST